MYICNEKNLFSVLLFNAILTFLPQSMYCNINILASAAEDTKSSTFGDHHQADFPCNNSSEKH